MAEDNRWREQEMRYNELAFSERLTWKGVGHVVDGEWTVRWGKIPHKRKGAHAG
jgi:hypothetical protein